MWERIQRAVSMYYFIQGNRNTYHWINIITNGQRREIGIDKKEFGSASFQCRHACGIILHPTPSVSVSKHLYENNTKTVCACLSLLHYIPHLSLYFILNISTFSKTILIIDTSAYSPEAWVDNLCLSFKMVKPHSGRSSSCSCIPLLWYPGLTNECRLQIPSEEAVAFDLLVRGTATCFTHDHSTSQPTFAQSGDIRWGERCRFTKSMGNPIRTCSVITCLERKKSNLLVACVLERPLSIGHCSNGFSPAASL